jgi:phage baseplate assembly protein gpV
MIKRGVVTHIDDPQECGRIRARVLAGEGETQTETPWAWPCSLLAGPEYGLFCLPRVGDEVWLTKADSGDWIWLGFSWRGDIRKPDGASDTKRIFRTPGGHQITFDDAADGKVEIKHATGSAVVIESDGHIRLGGEGGEKLLVTESFLGLFSSHVHTSAASGSPTGPPTVTATTAPPYVTTITRAE